jgi:hypothetical protein
VEIVDLLVDSRQLGIGQSGDATFDLNRVDAPFLQLLLGGFLFKQLLQTIARLI